MQKLIGRMAAFLLLISISVFPVSAAEQLPVYVDGINADIQGISFVENGTPYVPLSEVSRALGADDVAWDGASRTVAVNAKGLTLIAAVDQVWLEANGRFLYLPGGCRIVNDKMMVSVSALCRAFGAEAHWSPGKSRLSIVSGGEPISKMAPYSEDDLYWLSRIIHAEASGEPLEGKIAVGNVVLNRLADEHFPNTIYDVIFDFENGIQFTPAYTGSIYCNPSEESVLAAKLALDGADTAGDSLYFSADYIAAVSWAGQNRPFAEQIGNHCFYL